jgi:hypothetical protein
MPESFSLSPTDYKLLERAAIARFQRNIGRLNVAFFAQVLAWMFITLAVMTFFKLYERAPDAARPYGVILTLAVLGFVLASIRPLVGQWLYGKYVASSNDAFTSKQSVGFQDGSLVLESATVRSFVLPSAIIDYLEDERNHYLFLTGVQAITIPKAVATALGAEFTTYLAARRQ